MELIYHLIVVTIILIISVYTLHYLANETDGMTDVNGVLSALLSAGYFVTNFMRPFDLSWVLGFVALFTMLCISIVDFTLLLIPSGLVYGLIICFLMMHYPHFTTGLLYPSWIMFIIFYSLYTIPRHFFKKSMLGFGDVKLVTAIGILIPIEKVPLFLFFSATSCLTVTLLLSIIKGKKIRRSPFGPYLCIAATLHIMHVL